MLSGRWKRLLQEAQSGGRRGEGAAESVDRVAELEREIVSGGLTSQVRFFPVANLH